MPRSSAQRIRQPDRYGALLVLIAVDCVVIFTSAQRGPSRWLPAVLVGLTVLVGLDTSHVCGWWVNPTRVAAVAVAAAAVVDGLDGTAWTLGVLGVLQATALEIPWSWPSSADSFSTSRSPSNRAGRHLRLRAVRPDLFALLIFGTDGITGRQFFAQNPDPTFADFVYSASSS